MAESPSRDRDPNTDDASGDATAKGESDPLFSPGGLKTRRTVMGLAPAPHLGGSSARSSGASATEAEERKQRVLARIAAMDGGKDVTGPPPPLESNAPRGYSGPPPPRPAGSQAPPRMVHQTYSSGAPPKFGTGTVLMHPSGPVPRTISSDRRLPSASGWEVHGESAPEPPEVATELIEPPPITARMVSTLPIDTRSAPPVVASKVSPTQTAALAVRSYEPAYREPTQRDLTHLTDKRLVLVNETNSARAASYRLLRDNLLSKSMPRVVAVSSATPGDGKTTCAMNLALALSELRSTRVLLVDGNFFQPELGHVFGIERLSPIVPPDGNGSWLEPFKLVEVAAGMHLAAVVRRPGEPAPRFDQQRFEIMIDRLVRVAYDYIIIDAPALKGSPAVIQLITVADATLMAVRSGTTAGRDLRRAISQIPEKKAFGMALIDAAPQD
jgi:Mrp family chromosome partitioning ATPase